MSTECTRRLLAVDEASFEELGGKPFGLRDVLNFKPGDSCGKSCETHIGWEGGSAGKWILDRFESKELFSGIIGSWGDVGPRL